ncbi:MAG: hypothetical protein KDA89_18730 [Planctomycetaceae bacterium]|nr:hypothetical protein [Planctomycetaceae bacterium]
MRYRFVALSLILLCLGCYQADENNSADIERVRQESEGESDSGMRTATRRRIFSQLTRNSWTTDVLDERHPDRTVFRFHADGTYRIDLLTDYAIDPGEGAWNFLQDDDGTWWLMFDNGQREQFRFNDDRTLTFLGNRLQPDEPLEQTRTVDQLASITVPEPVQQAAAHLCSNRWQLSNDLNLYRQPTSVEFYPDWTYRTTYRYGECHTQGTWYATARPLMPGAHAAPIQAGSSLSKCDTRGPRPEHLNVEHLEEIGLLINGELYVPQEAATNRAVIWALFGYSHVVRVRVQYDMPIRQGVPHRFDIEFTIVDRDMSDLTLQRFSLTEKYDQGYRLAKHELGEIEEIAAADLKSEVLRRGDVHKASIVATFPKAGTQFVYFNAMMYDDRQDWDTRFAYELRVRARNEEE